MNQQKMFSYFFLSLFAIFSLIGCQENTESSENYSYSTERVNKQYGEVDIFHDQAAEYISNYEPTSDEEVILRVKVRHGSTLEAYVDYTFDYNAINPTYYSNKMEFEAVDNTGRYDYYIGAIAANEAPYQYHFHLKNKVDDVYYNRDGIFEEDPTSTAGDWSIYPNFNTPMWSQGALWYSIMPESYHNGNTLNDKTGAEYDAIWGGHNTSMGDWFGGDLQGINEKVDYLSTKFKIDAVFLNPLWVTNHNAGYGCYDFYQIDSSLGNNTDLLRLVSSLHEDELKIMLDAVFEYCNVNNILNNISKMYPDLIKDSYYYFLQRDESGEKINSVWGGALIDFSKEITRKYLYTEEESVMLSYIILFGIDAWRMDVGNTLSGTNAQNWGNATQILEDIRPYLKEVSTEILYLSEHADSNQLTNGILDSKWNYAFNSPLLDWCQNNSNAMVLASSLEDAMFGYPRGVTNSLYNFLTTHDMEYFYSQIGYDKTSFLSAEILLMTYLGSPCIYFGEEIGQVATKITDSGKMTNSFYTAMNWNEAEYDQDIYNLMQSLASLRKKYPNVFKNGGYINLYSDGKNNENDLYAYARFNKDVVIPIINRNNFFVEDFELSLYRLNIADGTILYDYMTNQKYEVKNGKVIVQVAPYGSILTTSPNESFTSTKYITQNDYNYINENTYQLQNENEKIFHSSMYQKGYNNYEISIDLLQVDRHSKFSAFISNEEKDTYYGVLYQDKELQLVYGNIDSLIYGKKIPISNDCKITIKRESDNICNVYLDQQRVNDFDQIINFDYCVELGVSQLSGTSIVQMNCSPLAQQTSTNFSSLSSMFFKVGAEDSFEISNNYLKIKGNDQTNMLLSPIGQKDFTCQMTFNLDQIGDNDHGGLVVGDDENDYIMLGKYKDKIVLAQVLNHQVAPYGEIDNINGNITLQIEKVGTTYKGKVLLSDQYIDVGTIHVNYSNLNVGIVNQSNVDLLAYNFGLGDLKEQIADYQFTGPIHFNNQDYLDSKVTIEYEILSGNKFSYQNGYLVQSSIEDDTKYLLKALYKNTTTTFSISTIDFANSSAYFALSFDELSKTSSNGYSLRIYEDKTLSLYHNETLLCQSKMNHFNEKTENTFHVKIINQYIYVYDGQQNLLLSYANREPIYGYLSYCSHQASYRLTSYGTFAEVGNYIQYEGAMYVSTKEGYYNLELSSNHSINYAGFRDQGLSDFALGFNAQLTRINTISKGYFDINIGISCGHYYLEGFVVRFDHLGRITIFENGVEMISNKTTSIENISSVYLYMTYIGNNFEIYGVNYDEREQYTTQDYFKILSYTTTQKYSGALSFYSKNAGVKMNHITGYGLSSEMNAFDLNVYKEIYLEEPIPVNGEVSSENGKDYFNSFDSNSSLATLDRYSGQIYIEEGNLVVNGYTTTNWDAGATITSGIYTNFELETKLKVGNDAISGSCGAISFYKSASSSNHQAKALTIVVYPTNYCALFIGNGILSSYGVNGLLDENGYITLKIRVSNGVITFSAGKEEISVTISTLSNNNTLNSGYISMNAMANIVYFDYIRIHTGD